jgi:hypothetical protein
MKPIAIISSLLLLLIACKNNETTEPSSDSDMDAARNFLDAALKGDFKEANKYMLQDSANRDYLFLSERSYQRIIPEKKDSMRKASLRFFDTRQVNDSTTITIFANSYRNDKDTLRIVRRSGQWLVDLKYLFEHDMDTNIYMKNNKIDTVQK